MKNAIKDIKYLVMDVDGTLTDGKIYMSNDGELIKAFNIKDGCGVHDVLPNCCIEPMIITGRCSDIVGKRCQEIGIKHVYQGVEDKETMLEEFLRDRGLDFTNVAYIGDDINDLKCMKKAGLVGCPHDAVDMVKAETDFIAPHNGGDGAVRDFIEWIKENGA